MASLAISPHLMKVPCSVHVQVCKNGIVHLAFHPGSSALIVATADKSGNMGLWSIDHQPQPLKQEELGESPSSLSSYPPCYCSSYKISSLRPPLAFVICVWCIWHS